MRCMFTKDRIYVQEDSESVVTKYNMLEFALDLEQVNGNQHATCEAVAIDGARVWLGGGWCDLRLCGSLKSWH